MLPRNISRPTKLYTLSLRRATATTALHHSFSSSNPEGDMIQACLYWQDCWALMHLQVMQAPPHPRPNGTDHSNGQPSKLFACNSKAMSVMVYRGNTAFNKCHWPHTLYMHGAFIARFPTNMNNNRMTALCLFARLRCCKSLPAESSCFGARVRVWPPESSYSGGHSYESKVWGFRQQPL